MIQDRPSPQTKHSPTSAAPVFEKPEHAEFAFHSVVGERVRANVDNWLIPAPAANPAMFEMFRDRDAGMDRNLVPWSGEFAGKHLTSAVLALRITRDEGLRRFLGEFVPELIACQDEDGYLGPFPREERLFGPNKFEPHNCGEGIWDLWGHYHCMLGLYLWYKETGDKAAFDCCLRSADYICSVFLDGPRRVVDTKAEEMNQSSIHIFTLLYQETGDPRHLELAREIQKDWETPPSGDYLRCALAGTPFYVTPRPRWESLPSIQALGELYYISGDDRYRSALEHTWWSIVETDRHSTGGFSSFEQATGNPYDLRAIETCCTVAWMALTVDMLRLTGDSRAADELELSTFSATLGSQHPSGRWWTYNTPMNGVRKASPIAETSFQARPGSPELNCCSVNGPRSLGMLSEWAVMRVGDGIALNYYGSSEFAIDLLPDCRVRLIQQTDYPVSGRVTLTVSPDVETSFGLRLRIPGWSRNTSVSVNGRDIGRVEAGSYAVIGRSWKQGDRIEIAFEMSPRLWVGERDCAGKVAIYHGPLLMAYDPRFDAHHLGELPRLDLSHEPVAMEIKTSSPQPLMLLRFATDDGRGITLCDFASAGATGTPYMSWLDAGDWTPIDFTRDNPMRCAWTTNTGAL